MPVQPSHFPDVEPNGSRACLYLTNVGGMALVEQCPQEDFWLQNMLLVKGLYLPMEPLLTYYWCTGLYKPAISIWKANQEKTVITHGRLQSCTLESFFWTNWDPRIPSEEGWHIRHHPCQAFVMARLTLLVHLHLLFFVRLFTCKLIN